MRFKLSREDWIKVNISGAHTVESYEDIKAVVYRFIRGTHPTAYPYAVIFTGRRNTPDLYEKYKTEDAREARITHNLTLLRERKAAMDLAREERKGYTHNLDVGTILSYGWGYDQTNVNFFQVTRRNEKSVWIREIGAQRIEGSEGFMSCKLQPHRDAFLPNAPELCKRVTRGYNNDGMVTMRHGVATKCAENSEHYCSWYA